MSMFYELMMRKKGMPERYQEVEYLESSGTQWIDTGVKSSPQIEVRIIAQNQSTSGIHYYFGSWQNDSTALFFGIYNTTDGYILRNGNASAIQVLNTNKNILDKHTIIYTNTQIKIDDYSYSYSGSSYTEGINIYLFTNNKTEYLTNRSLVGKIYSCQIYDNGTLVRNFIPVYDTLTNKYGMWESVQGKFYGNDGTGDFTGA